MSGLNRFRTAPNGLLTIFLGSHECQIFFRFVKNHILIRIVVLITPENQNIVSYIAFNCMD